MSSEIIYTNLAAKPTRLAPAPETPAAAPAPQVKRIRIGWGEAGRNGVAVRSDEIALASASDREQPQRELGDRSAPTVRPSRSSLREMRSPQSPKVRMRYVDRGSRLERIPGQRLLCEKLERQSARPELEHLTILHSPKAQQYWIADAETGEIFLRQPFATLKHCYEAAAELERTFAIAQVLEMRSPETMESVGELVREHWLREQVAGILL